MAYGLPDSGNLAGNRPALAGDMVKFYNSILDLHQREQAKVLNLQGTPYGIEYDGPLDNFTSNCFYLPAPADGYKWQITCLAYWYTTNASGVYLKDAADGSTIDSDLTLVGGSAAWALDSAVMDLTVEKLFYIYIDIHMSAYMKNLAIIAELVEV